jgi:hypothetical protein
MEESKTKFITDSRLEIEMKYPIGKNMPNLIFYCDVMAQLIREHAPINDRRLHFLCRGSSGAILAGIVASRLPHNNVYITHFKKPGEYSHAGEFMCEGDDYFIVIDDFMASGTTLNTICEKMLNVAYQFPDMLIVSGNVNSSFKYHKEIETIICGSYYIEPVAEYSENSGYYVEAATEMTENWLGNS